MLSVILYGRNDDHGYNYHKRLAISLNCLAEILTDSSDEIIFVDYNTSNELPTIIEAIQDTLTVKAKSLLRILRVRPFQHQRFAKQTALPLLEPVARNVAIRRMRPDNDWVLSTNIDMIFVSEKGESLSQIVSDLKEGFYLLPRFELPENLWELSLERLNPAANISLLRKYSQNLHLNTVIRKEGCIQFDNPGDFQLMLRKDILEMGGFDEQMLKGWHVDSNLCKRMSLAGKAGCSLEKHLKGYHCNHTYKESFLHSQNRTQNDWYQFVESSSITPVLTQPNWGLVDEEIEEISLPSQAHLNATLSSLERSLARNEEFLVTPSLYNRLVYSPSRIFVYLADHLCNLPANTNIVYVGYNLDLACKMRAYLTHRNFKGQLLCQEEFAAADLYIFDFGIDEHSTLGQEGYEAGRKKIKKILSAFFATLRGLRGKNQEAKFIGINVNYTDFGIIFNRHLSVRLNSYITGISYGYFFPKKRSRKFSISSPRMKKRAVLLLRYLIARHLYGYSDTIRRFALKIFP